MECMSFIFSKLKLPNSISTSNSYEPQYDNLVDLRYKKWDDLQDHSSYVQVWEDKFGFTPNLSILDLLFCMGPESISYLRKIEQKIP